MAYDALLLASFGGPEAPEEVMPFLERVTAGRGVPRERLELVAQNYAALGGVSPINAQTRALRDALEEALRDKGVSLPFVVGNRNSPPYFADVLAELAGAGHRSVLAVATSAYPSYSGCRQYRENLAAACPAGLDVRMLGPYAELDGFVAPFADGLTRALESVGDARTHVLFTTHSLPLSLADTSGPAGGAYVEDHLTVAERVIDAAGAVPAWSLTFQSRSGSPRVPWLEPDVNDEIERLAAEGLEAIVVVPIGFVSDHVEVVYDLDTQAAATARRAGVRLLRVTTAGTDPRFVDDLARLLADTLAGVPRTGPAATRCGVGCCTGGDARPAVPPP